MNARTCKVDLHVHSLHSQRPASWVLQKIGASECYTPPSIIYRKLIQGGMDLVTITDHNTIEGCLEIGHLENTFVSEEVTSYFPEDGCKLHVLVYHIDEKQHRDIARARKNVFELVDLLNAEQIIHAVAHPLYSVNGKLTREHVQKLLLLFKRFELNGARDAFQNTALRRIVASLTPERIGALASRHDIRPRGARPWEKRFIGGSDDHAGVYMGLSYTTVPGVSSIETFLDGVRSGRTEVHTHAAEPETLAHTIYSVMYQFYDNTFDVRRWIPDADLTRFLEETLRPSGRRRSFGHIFKAPFQRKKRSAAAESPVIEQYLQNAMQALFADPGLTAHARCHTSSPERLEEVWLRFVHRVSAALIKQFARETLSRLNQADMFSLFTAFGASAPLYLMLSPYFIAHKLFARDRAFSLRCLEDNGAPDADLSGPGRNVAAFTDTFREINGVATAIRSQVAGARATGKPLTLIHCAHESREAPNVASFEPVGEFDLPEYPELKVYCPPILSILSFCYRRRFTHIHAETPGAMGLTALAVSRILNLPFSGTYHTSLPQTVGALTGDHGIEDLFWKYLVWFYGQMERIYVPSSRTGEELVAKGLPRGRIVVHPWGVDTSTYHPGKRNGFLKARYHIGDETVKLLYVGRVSREKNVQVFEGMMRKICRLRDDVHLVVVGEGPYLSALKKALADLPVTFTGYLTGEDLAQAYASSDLFVFPSTVDTMGNVVLEAQASGLPVIVTDQGGPSENMIDQKTGVVIPADDRMPDRLAEAVLSQCAHPDRMAAMGRYARRYTEDRSFQECFLEFWNTYD